MANPTGSAEAHSLNAFVGGSQPPITEGAMSSGETVQADPPPRQGGLRNSGVNPHIPMAKVGEQSIETGKKAMGPPTKWEKGTYSKKNAIDSSIEKKTDNQLNMKLIRKPAERNLVVKPLIRKKAERHLPTINEDSSATASSAKKTEKETPVIDPKISKQLRKNASVYGLSEEQLKAIEKYYADNKNKLSGSEKPVFIHRGKDNPELSRSLVFIPGGPRAGMYVLLKTHGNIPEIGRGSFNRATLALHLDTGEKKIFRNARKEDVPEREVQANEITSNYPAHFAAGVPVEYTGPWRNRREANAVREGKNVQKLGMIMDFIEGGELAAKIHTFNNKQKLEIAKEYVQSLAILHGKKLVHLDQKTENTFMTKDGHPRISDFGFTASVGTRVGFVGTPGLIAPEVLRYGERYEADYPADIWSLGCLLADLFNKGWYEIHTDIYLDDLDSNKVSDMQGACFENSYDSYDIDYVINQCLSFYPEDRPSVSTVVELLNSCITNGGYTI